MIYRILLVVVAICTISDAAPDDSADEVLRSVRSPADQVPDAITKSRLGMSYTDVVKILGEPDYSPTEGQFYHATEGRCTAGGGPAASCGFVLEYRIIEYGGDGIVVTLPDDREEYRLQGCS